MYIIDININSNKEYKTILKFVEENNCEILYNNQLSNKWYMMVIRVSNENLAWELMSRKQ